MRKKNAGSRLCAITKADKLKNSKSISLDFTSRNLAERRNGQKNGLPGKVPVSSIRPATKNPPLGGNVGPNQGAQLQGGSGQNPAVPLPSSSTFFQIIYELKTVSQPERLQNLYIFLTRTNFCSTFAKIFNQNISAKKS